MRSQATSSQESFCLQVDSERFKVSRPLFYARFGVPKNSRNKRWALWKILQIDGPMKFQQVLDAYNATHRATSLEANECGMLLKSRAFQKDENGLYTSVEIVSDKEEQQHETDV